MVLKNGVTETVVFLELKSGFDKWEGSVFYDIEHDYIKINKNKEFEEFKSKVLEKEDTKVEMTIFTGAHDPICSVCDISEVEKEDEIQ